MTRFLTGITSIFSTAALLDYLGLESKRTMQARAMTYTGLLISGAAIGAVAALMLAPKPGRELRADMGNRARQLGSRVGVRSKGYYPSTASSQKVSNAPMTTPEGLSGI
jgi:uncharacterized membrane protein YebE (DUF533 family)